MTSTWGDQDRRTESSRLACATIGNPILTGKETDRRTKKANRENNTFKIQSEEKSNCL